MPVVLVATSAGAQVYLFKSLQLCIDSQNAEGGTDSAIWLLRADSHRLFLQDGSSKDYA